MVGRAVRMYGNDTAASPSPSCPPRRNRQGHRPVSTSAMLVMAPCINIATPAIARSGAPGARPLRTRDREALHPAGRPRGTCDP